MKTEGSRRRPLLWAGTALIPAGATLLGYLASERWGTDRDSRTVAFGALEKRTAS